MTNNDKLEMLANKILNKTNITNKHEYGSLILTIMIISVILTLVRVIQECHSKKILTLDKRHRSLFVAQEIQNLSVKRTWFNQIRLKRILKQKLSPDIYALYGDSLKLAIMDVGSTLTDEESQILLEAIDV